MQILIGVTIFAGTFFIALVVLQTFSILKKHFFNNEKKLINKIFALKQKLNNVSYSSFVRKNGTVTYGYGNFNHKKEVFEFPLEEDEI